MSKIHFLLCVASAGAICACAAANAGPSDLGPGITGTLEYSYFDVNGRTAYELANSVLHQAPVAGTATGKAVGEERTTPHMSWQTVSNGDNCTVKSVAIFLKSEILLPRWTPPPNAEPGLRAWWTRYLTAIERHEVGHKEVSLRFARELQDSLQTLSAPCTSLTDTAQQIQSRLYMREREEQARYDLGRGPAEFPPWP